MATRTFDKSESRSRCHGEVKHSMLTGHTRRESLVEIKETRLPRRQLQSNKGYETNQSTYLLVIICNRKQGHYSDRRICEMMTLNEIRYNPVTSTFWLIVDIIPLLHPSCLITSREL